MYSGQQHCQSLSSLSSLSWFPFSFLEDSINNDDFPGFPFSVFVCDLHFKTVAVYATVLHRPQWTCWRAKKGISGSGRTLMLQLSFFFESCPCFSFVELDWIGHWTVELSQAKYDDDKDSFFTRQTLSGIVIVRLRCAKTCGHCQSVFADWFVILCCLCSSWQVDLLSSWFVFLVCLWVWLLRQAVPLTPLLTCQWWTKKLSGILSSRDMGILAILSSIQHVGRRTFWGLCTIEW